MMLVSYLANDTWPLRSLSRSTGYGLAPENPVYDQKFALRLRPPPTNFAN